MNAIAIVRRLLERVGGNPAIVRDWLGHANLNTTNRYLVTSQGAFASALKLWNAAAARPFAPDLHKPADQPIPADHDSPAEVSENSVS